MNHSARFSLPRKQQHVAPRPVAGFMACPVTLLPQVSARLELVEAVYQHAFREAQAVVQPSILERNLCWN
jgi:hypothetical protein